MGMRMAEWMAKTMNVLDVSKLGMGMRMRMGIAWTKSELVEWMVNWQAGL